MTTTTDDDHTAGDADELVLDEVEWQTDDDGTEWFAHEGWRYELDEDGYAYSIRPFEPTGDEERPTESAATDADQSADADQLADATPLAAAAPRVADGPDLDGYDGEVLPGTAVPPVQPRGYDLKLDEGNPTTELAPVAAGSEGAALLRLSGVRSGYGALPVLHGVDLELAEGETAVLFGLNGAGKTTTAMNICGALATWAGSIEFDGEDVTRWNTKRCVDAGIVMVPEGRRVFPELSVERNLQVGSWAQRRDASWVASQREVVLDYFPRLRERLQQLAGTLSGGEQQMLAIARGLMARPKLLIIDEASMGLAPVIVKDVFDIVRAINDDGVTVLLIEQNVGALDVADIGAVMAQGSIVKTLTAEELTDRSVVSRLLMG